MTTPFVNRRREVVEVALYNANYIFRLKKYERMDDYRASHFVFAAQMYGAGKTRLGLEFLNQLEILLADKSEPFLIHCPAIFESDIDELLKIV
jgi:hypothetical protein